MHRHQVRAGLAILFGIILFSLSGCCARNSDGSKTCFGNCSDEVNGYALFGNGTAPTAGRTVVLQWSDDHFATKVNYGTSVDNQLGLIAIPFKFSATYACGAAPQIQVRAYEATNGSSSWSNGNIVGRHDGTTDGNGTLISIPVNSAHDVLIYLDATGAQ